MLQRFQLRDFHHWFDLINHFVKRIKLRKDLNVADNILAVDPPFPRGVVLSVLCDLRISLGNSTNKDFYSSYEGTIYHCILYLSIDKYLKEHPALSKSERSNICGLMNCKKLYVAVQNECHSLRVAALVIFFQQIRASKVPVL
ncbi:hypothetical protein MKW98_022483 [Papaver atlanticum]|uniref:NPH3 domain-containing protein n=1 Tax=Papaver atlanticum TaxID=357466 RepID=A0AAD4T5E5_9MAGN|nr:hypothetical protein MKW98_022483 [Papaver atlanticum]